ncbi:YsnF/AvaK domain-containing protein [Desertivirga brevis]|uniref:YsnF/AvaK domain-containing protein n=1 Tax=Desertivirga brevis TaxID=2810310 RepID=UPI001A977A90|nr:YsnF/AvaK domain-containing protein [Pedobacter sp. SYSU D00873]
MEGQYLNSPTNNQNLDSNGIPNFQEGSKEKIVIPVVEEQLRIEKQVIETGKVTVSKKVNEYTESIDIPVTNEEVDVNRIEINQYVNEAPPAVRQEGNKTIIPILKEVLVVEKKLLLVEEVHITRKQVKTSTTRQETLKKEEMVISRTETEPDHNKSN